MTPTRGARARGVGRMVGSSLVQMADGKARLNTNRVSQGGQKKCTLMMLARELNRVVQAMAGMVWLLIR